ncbi:MAG: 2-oxo acid dehydrogenase subunit E2, partial [Azospirillaceae bacterium]
AETAPNAAPAPAAAKAPARGRGLDMAEMRKAIAAAMAKSKREIPHYYLATEIDLSAADAHLAALNAEREPADRLLPGVLTMKATAQALKRMPQFNGFHGPDGFTPSDRVHMGTAVAIRGGGLIAPAIHDADTLSLDALMAALKDLVARVRSGGLRSSELSDPTVTVTALGERGVETVYGVIYPPQVALIGFGKPVRKVVPVTGPDGRGEAVAIRPRLTATLAADHRVSDGRAGGLFLAEIDKLLQSPEAL